MVPIVCAHVLRSYPVVRQRIELRGHLAVPVQSFLQTLSRRRISADPIAAYGRWRFSASARHVYFPSIRRRAPRSSAKRRGQMGARLRRVCHCCSRGLHEVGSCQRRAWWLPGTGSAANSLVWIAPIPSDSFRAVSQP